MTFVMKWFTLLRRRHKHITKPSEHSTMADTAGEASSSDPLLFTGASGSPNRTRGTLALQDESRKLKQLRPLVLSAVLESTANKIFVQTPDDEVSEISGEVRAGARVGNNVGADRRPLQPNDSL